MEPDSEHVWQDQWGLICVLNRMGLIDPISTISHKWNSVVHRQDLTDPDPAVVAWHGQSHLAMTDMKSYLEKYT